MQKWLLLLLVFIAMNVSADSEHIIPMVRHDAATFYINVEIADQISEEFVIDTGSSHVTITRATLTKLLEKEQATFVRFMTAVLADGSNIDLPIYRVSSLNIGGNCRFENIEVAVIDGDTRCVLGLSVLSRAAPFTFHIEPPQLQLSNCTT